MRTMKASCGLAAALLLACAASSANALAMRTWVSGAVGNDANPCSRTAPCQSFEATLAKTEAGGEISVLDPGGYGTVTINKSITINGTPGSGYGSTLGWDFGIVIDLPASDPFKTVRLNWLDISGQHKSKYGIRILNSQPPGVSVVIENTNVDGFTSEGIRDDRTAGGKITIANTVVRHTGLYGILLSASAKNKLQATLSNVRVHNSGLAALRVNGGAKAMVSNSVFSGSATGIMSYEAGTAFIDDSTISGNTTGLTNDGVGVLWLSNSEVSFNDTDVAGPVESFSDNRFISNGPGGALNPIGQPSSPTGQQ